MNLLGTVPIGIRDFEKIREEDYLYIDKTELVYNLTHSGSFSFLCRPRGFGKSLLVSTLECYFKARRDLFEGLAIDQLEKDWQEHTVLRLDLSTDVYTEEGTLSLVLNHFLREHEKRYSLPEEKLSFSLRFSRIIRAAYEESGHPIVILIDDYDKPVLDAIFTPTETENRALLREFYAALSANDFYLKFVFMTGITKFASINVFNGEHLFRDISLYKEYNALCGFTLAEIERFLLPPQPDFAPETVLSFIKDTYDGYRFSSAQESLCNPYSVLCALDAHSSEDGETGFERILFWAQTGQPAMLIKLMFSHKCNLFDLLYGVRVFPDDLMEYRWTEEDVIPLVYQAGYLSITDVEPSHLLHLAPPNKEVRTILCRNLLSFVSSFGKTSTFSVEIEALRHSLLNGDVAAFIARFGQGLKDVALIRQKKESAEYIARLAFHAVANMMGTVIKDGNASVMLIVSQEKQHEAYIFELKMEKNLALEDIFTDAFMHIQEKHYVQSVQNALGNVPKDDILCHEVAIVFNSTKGTISGWKEVSVPLKG